jgi:hypothetical protein
MIWLVWTSNSERREIGQVETKEADKKRGSQVWKKKPARDETGI